MRTQAWIRSLSDVSYVTYCLRIHLTPTLVFGLPPAFVAAALGDVGVQEVAGLEAKVCIYLHAVVARQADVRSIRSQTTSLSEQMNV